MIQTVLAAQLVSRGLLDGQSSNGQQPPIVVEAPPVAFELVYAASSAADQ